MKHPLNIGDIVYGSIIRSLHNAMAVNGNKWQTDIG